MREKITLNDFLSFLKEGGTLSDRIIECKLVISETFDHAVNLDNCTFTEEVKFKDCIFHGAVKFDKCNFCKGSEFLNAQFKNVLSINNSEFHGHNIFHLNHDSINESAFGGSVYCRRNTIFKEAILEFKYFVFIQSLVFENNIIEDTGCLKFRRVDFRGEKARYYFKINPHDEDKEIFSEKQGELLFENCVASTHIRIVESNLNRLNFDSFTLNSSIDYILLDEGGERVVDEHTKKPTINPSYEPKNIEAKQQFYNVLKYHAKKRDDTINALKYHAKEMGNYYFKVTEWMMLKLEKIFLTPCLLNIVKAILLPILVDTLIIIVVVENIDSFSDIVISGLVVISIPIPFFLVWKSRKKISKWRYQCCLWGYKKWYPERKHYTEDNKACKAAIDVLIVLSLVAVFLWFLYPEIFAGLLIVFGVSILLLIGFSQDGFLLLANYISNNHGLSWRRGVIFTLFTALCFFVLINRTLPENERLFTWGWKNLDSFLGVLKLYLKMLNPLNALKSEAIFGRELKGDSWFIFYFSQIVIAFGIYQTVAAFRKFRR